MIEEARTRLETVFAAHGSAAVAVSGGVDSMTLAHLAFRHYGRRLSLFHAASPAVPAEARARIERHAEWAGWRLTVLDAGELEDERYRENPVNRCYFCKNNLFSRLRSVWQGTAFTGANRDDLGDYRPGLKAAEEFRIVHPFIEAGIDKTTVRALAQDLGLDDLAELPASPCLASRVVTHRRIEAHDLLAIDRIETELRRRVGNVTLRCRLAAEGAHVQLEGAVYDSLSEAGRRDLEAEAARLCAEAGWTWHGLSPYRRGSAFVH